MNRLSTLRLFKILLEIKIEYYYSGKKREYKIINKMIKELIEEVEYNIQDNIYFKHRKFLLNFKENIFINHNSKIEFQNMFKNINKSWSLKENKWGLSICDYSKVNIIKYIEEKKKYNEKISIKEYLEY